MATLWRHARPYIKRCDLPLLLLALIGLIVYAAVLPGQHPYGAADFSKGDVEVASEARGLLSDHGFTLQDVRVEPREHSTLLDSLQLRLGRTEATRYLRSDTGQHVPAFYWRVRGGVDADDIEQVRAHFTTGGDLWYLSYEPVEEGREPRVRRDALANLLEADEEALQQLPDSLLVERLRFIDDEAVTTPALTKLTIDDLREGPVEISPDGVEALVRYHLEATALRHFEWEVESVAVQPNSLYPSANVQMRAVTGPAGTALQLEASVTPTGELADLRPQFAYGVSGSGLGGQAEAADDPSWSPVLTIRGFASALTVLGYLLLAIVLLAIFVGRLGARMIDTKSAFRDAVLGGGLAAGMMASVATTQIMADIGDPVVGILLASMTVALVGALGAIVIFVVSSAVDSYTREVWPVKLETITVARQGGLLNVPVGLALLRGVAVGATLLGSITLVLALAPGAGLLMEANELTAVSTEVLSFSLLWVSLYGWLSLFFGLLVVLGMGAALYRRVGTWYGVVGGLTIVFAVLQISPLNMATPGFDWLVAGIVGVIVALAFWHYNVFTCIIGLFILYVGWSAAPQWIMSGAPFLFDAALVGLLTIGLVVFGLVGVGSGRSGEEIAPYVPEYVREITQQQRLQQELDIAREVQSSLLPRSVPEVEGIDLAAVCLAANEVGGDYYDFIPLENHRLGIAIGDVSGKGIQAAFFMTLAKGFLQTLSREYEHPKDVLYRLNELFYENVPRGTFVSMVYGVLDLKQRTFTFARAGHNPIILHRLGEATGQTLRPTGIAIGLTRGHEFVEQMESNTISLDPSDVLVFYTDGLSEATNQEKEQYGEERMLHRIAELKEPDAQAVLQYLTDDIARFTKGTPRHDDMTAVVLRLTDRVSGDNPSVRLEDTQGHVTDHAGPISAGSAHGGRG